ncbi:MAG TPA: Crp/Fnr family transcriptional regulator [Candidatus Saccharimonadales bacterium]|nr:Crp/Fnr family transcriptional regulator [Candidatus Saccharimonadales bacterium]
MPKYRQSSLVRNLFTKGQPLAFSKGECILGNDAEPDGVYFLDTGYVKAYSISNEGDEYLHVIYGSGDIFPLPWAYLGTWSEHLFYEGISDCVVWRISRDWFHYFVTQRLDVSHAMSLEVAQQLRLFGDRLDNLEYKKASERVACRVLQLAGRFGVERENEMVIDSPITHENLANSINLARESVSRELERLEHDRIITRANHRIHIRDLGALTARLGRPLPAQD